MGQRKLQHSNLGCSLAQWCWPRGKNYSLESKHSLCNGISSRSTLPGGGHT